MRRSENQDFHHRMQLAKLLISRQMGWKLPPIVIERFANNFTLFPPVIVFIFNFFWFSSLSFSFIRCIFFKCPTELLCVVDVYFCILSYRNFISLCVFCFLFCLSSSLSISYLNTHALSLSLTLYFSCSLIHSLKLKIDTERAERRAPSHTFTLESLRLSHDHRQLINAHSKVLPNELQMIREVKEIANNNVYVC